MNLPILDASAWREFRGKPANIGINETTHLAKIADQSGKLHDCFVKLLPLDGPALLCEAMGWLLARASGVACPEFAAIVMVPVPELKKCCALPPTFNDMSSCPAWCSEIVSGKTVRQVHKMSFFVARKNCLRSKDARKIAAFDQWSDLRDRNFGNVIQASKGGYVAIDHETLLHELLWAPTGRTFLEKSLLAEARKSLSPAEFQRFQIDMANAAKDHPSGLTDASGEIAEIIEKIAPTDAVNLTRSVMQALGQRSQSGWLSNALGVIA